MARGTRTAPQAVAEKEKARRPLRALAISRLALHQLYEGLPPTRQRFVWDLVEWLLRGPRTIGSTEQVVVDLCRRLNEAGLPLDRYGSSTTVVTAEHDAIGRVWTREQGSRETVYVRPKGDDPLYLSSPLYEADRTGGWIELWLPETADTRFGIVPELKASGFVHYLCIPLRLMHEASGWVTMATRRAEGFSAEDLKVIALVIPALTSRIDVRSTWLTLDRLLRTYVGDEPHQAILAGAVKRGQVSTIRSAILFADMRDSTGHTADIGITEAVTLFNDFFDALVPPIENRNGEVLKYIGDGLLAIFRERGEVAESGVDRALDAADEIFVNLRRFNDSQPGRRPVEAGVALHYGEVAYGNVGSGLRLDFTVIGRDVGLASRIGSMNARLSEPLLMSQAFVDRLTRPVVPLGAYAARGFAGPIAVYRPKRPEMGEHDDP